MNYELKSLPKSEIEITVILPFSEFEPHVKRAASSISEEIEIEGFRRGKAPYEMVKNKVGEATIYERAAEIAVRKTYPEVLEGVSEEKSKAGETFLPIGRPEITVTKLAPGNELQYKVKVAVMPKVSLPDYKEIAGRVRREKKEILVSDEEILKTLDWIRESRSPLITVNREAQNGDRVEIDFEVRHGGVKIEGGESQGHPLILGQSKFIPGFEEKLIGMKAGEEKTFNLQAPKDWHEKNLAGKSLDFKVNMKLVQERRLPELNDELAKNLGNFSGLEALTSSIREGITKEKKEKEAQRLRALLIEKISEGMGAEIPEVLVDSELEKMALELKSGIESMGLKWEDYLMHIKKTPGELKRDWQPEAEKRVRAALALRAIAEKENLAASREEVESRANEFLRQHGSPEKAEKGINADELREYTRGVIRNEKVFEFLEHS